MTKTVTSLFRSEQHATAAASHLEQAGIPRDRIDTWSTPHNLAAVLEDAGVPGADAHAYVEGVRRGGSVVIVRCDDAEVERVASILDREGVLDLDEQQAAWRSEGWPGHEALPSSGLAAGPAGRAASSTSSRTDAEVGGDLAGSPDMTGARTDAAAASGRDEAAPVASKVVGHGRFRIQSYVVVTRTGRE